MQTVQHQTLDLPFDNLSDVELAHYCDVHLASGGELPLHAQRTLVDRLAAAAYIQVQASKAHATPTKYK